MADEPKNEDPPKRVENPIFTIWVHVGYTVLVLSMISWMVYMEYFGWPLLAIPFGKYPFKIKKETP